MVDVVVILIDVIDHEGKLFVLINFIKLNFCFIFSRERRQRSDSPVARDRRRPSRSRSPYSRSPVPRR
jgi:hypothetical protein